MFWHICLVLAVFLTFCGGYSFAEKVMRTNQMPKTMAEYYEQAKKAAENKNPNPEPKIEKDDTIINMPDPKIGLKKYNNPPGMVETNLKTLKKKHQLNSIGVASADGTKMLFTRYYYYPTSKMTASELFVMDLDTSKGLKDRLEAANTYRGVKSLYKTGMSTLDYNIQRTLTILDWSADGNMAAIKEKIAYSEDGLWKTNLLVYDFKTEKLKDLSEIRAAIRYYWKNNEGIDLNASRWDIFPVGWDALNPERIIVFGYAYTGGRPKFLGTWSIDAKGDRSMLMSLTSANFQISQNGIALKLIAD